MSIENKQFQEGLEKSFEHAETLATASIAIFNIGHYRPSINLAFQAMEEFGKVLLLKQDIIDKRDNISEGRWERVYKDHPRKIKEVEKAIHKNFRQYHGFKQKNGKLVRKSDEESLEEITKIHIDTKFTNQYVNWNFEKYMWESPLTEPSIVDIREFTESILSIMNLAHKATSIEVTNLRLGF